jgi:hypothetical protein
MKKQREVVQCRSTRPRALLRKANSDRAAHENRPDPIRIAAEDAATSPSSIRHLLAIAAINRRYIEFQRRTQNLKAADR